MDKRQLIKSEIKDDPRAYLGYESRKALALSLNIHYYTFSKLFTEIMCEDPDLCVGMQKIMAKKYSVAIGKVRECRGIVRDNNVLLLKWGVA